MTILFLHGWQSVVGGVKPSYLIAHGHQVINPALPDEDFAEAVRIAQEEFDRHRPEVVVGSSRGGGDEHSGRRSAARVALPGLEALGSRDDDPARLRRAPLARRRRDPLRRKRRADSQQPTSGGGVYRGRHRSSARGAGAAGGDAPRLRTTSLDRNRCHACRSARRAESWAEIIRRMQVTMYSIERSRSTLSLSHS